MIPQNQEKKQEIIDKLLENLPISTEIPIELPSKNKLDYVRDSSKPIAIRAITFEDEKALASVKGRGDILSILLSRCVSNINLAEILPSDRLYLLLKLREISYSDDYNFEVNCQYCSSENKGSVKLSELSVKYAPDDFSEVTEVFLSGLKKKVKVKILKVKDEAYCKDSLEIISNLWRFVEEIDNITDKSVISEVIQKLPSKDIKKIVSCLNPAIGVDTTIGFECASCKKLNTISLPITSDFFSES